MFLVLIALSTAGCVSTKPTISTKEFVLSGEVVRVNAKERIVTIRHQKIEGWMEAMTMDFPVCEGENLVDLQPGNHIKGKVYVDGLTFAIGDISPTSR